MEMIQTNGVFEITEVCLFFWIPVFQVLMDKYRTISGVRQGAGLLSGYVPIRIFGRFGEKIVLRL